MNAFLVTSAFFIFTRRCLRVDSNEAISSVRVALFLFSLSLSLSIPLSLHFLFSCSFILILMISLEAARSFANETQELLFDAEVASIFAPRHLTISFYRHQSFLPPSRDKQKFRREEILPRSFNQRSSITNIIGRHF